MESELLCVLIIIRMWRTFDNSFLGAKVIVDNVKDGYSRNGCQSEDHGHTCSSSLSANFQRVFFLWPLYSLPSQPELVDQTFPVAINVDLEHTIILEISKWHQCPLVYWWDRRLSLLCQLMKSNQRCWLWISLGPGESRSCGFFSCFRLLFLRDQPVNINRIR